MKYNGLVFFDMDGVLANCQHRLKYIQNDDYDSFYAPSNVQKDLPIKAGMDLLKMFIATGYKPVIVTSRREISRNATISWLKYWGIDISPEDVYTRGFGDTRKSWAVKLDLTENAIQENMDIYMSGTNYFVDDYLANCQAIAGRYKSMQVLVFGCNRINDNGGEL